MIGEHSFFFGESIDALDESFPFHCSGTSNILDDDFPAPDLRGLLGSVSE